MNSARSIRSCITSIAAACKDVDAEIVLVDASDDDTVAQLGELSSAVRVRRMAMGTLVPKLWSTGLAMSRGRVVAFTTGHFAVAEGWARALLSGIDRGSTGAAGRLTLSPESDLVDAAVFYLRYSAFLSEDSAEVVAEIPGDNAAYRRDVLDRHSASFADGFWEVDFHRRARADDPATTLSFVLGAAVRFGPSDTLGSFARQRFAHGSHFGAWRVRTGMRASWQIVTAAPLVPFLLIARIARRVLPHPSHRLRFVASLPALAVLAVAWSAGEVWGALTHTRPTAMPNHGLAA